MGGDFLLYGSTGYVGRAVAELARERGWRPRLAGRTGAAVAEQAGRLGLDYCAVAVDDASGLDAALAEVPVALNCAGPFVHTAAPLAQACLRTGTHYVDITGEPPVYEALAALDDRAADAGVMLLPSAGFDVVPTDCLAAHLVRRLPTATRLTLAFRQRGPAALPPGTVATLIEMVPYGSNKRHRVDGEVVAARRRPTRMIDFGAGPVKASLLTWGDVFLAHRSTGIPTIEDYMVLPTALVRQLDLIDRLRPLFRVAAVRAAARKVLPGGATAAERARTTTSVWGEVVDDDDNRAVGRIHGPEAGLVWTARTAIDVVGHVVSGDVTPGFQTPATAYGPDLVLESEGVEREDVT